MSDDFQFDNLDDAENFARTFLCVRTTDMNRRMDDYRVVVRVGRVQPFAYRVQQFGRLALSSTEQIARLLPPGCSR